MIKNIIFDWSGPIKDVSNAIEWIGNYISRNAGGKKMTLEEIRQNWEQPYMRFWNKYFPNMTMEEQQKLYREAIDSEECPESKPYPGIVELVKELKNRGVSMSVLSSDPDTLPEEIKKFNLENIFDQVFFDVHDKGEAIDELIEKNEYDRSKTVFIGDSNHEIEVGKSAGIKTIAVTWGIATENNLEANNPDYLVHNVKELEEILLS